MAITKVLLITVESALKDLRKSRRDYRGTKLIIADGSNAEKYQSLILMAQEMGIELIFSKTAK